MTQFKGENATVSLVVEDNGWGEPPTSYAGGKVLQSNDGTFNAERSALESEARVVNAELGGQRLGNKNVSGSFPVEIDPKNYNELLESVLYGRFTQEGSATAIPTSVLTGDKYTLIVPLDEIDEGTLSPVVGNAYRLSGSGTSEIQALHGVHVLIAFDDDLDIATFFVPEQTSAGFVAAATDVITITPVDTLRPARSRQSFNAEEILTGEDGVTLARFMTSGVVATGAELDLPSDNTLKSTFSFIGSGKTASSRYETFDASLTNDTTAHTSVVAHTKYDPMVLQDGAIISEVSDVRCQWLSGTVSIENGTEAFHVGCSYDAAGATSGKFRVKVSYEALFESEEAFNTFEDENTSKLLLRLAVRDSEECLLLYMPAFKATSMTVNVSTGLVTASISGSAEVDPVAVNSLMIASHSL